MFDVTHVMLTFINTRLLADKEAKDRSLQFVATAEILSGSVLALYEGTAMPKSDSTFTG
jgi:hypothetical protein